MAIKKLDPSARFKLISELDDSIIHETKEELEALKSDAKDKEGNPISAPTRYEQYLEAIDESKLKFRKDSKPSYFHFRCLTNQEIGELQDKYLDYDVKAKKTTFKGPKMNYFAEIFEKGVIALEDENGVQVKVGPNEVGIGVMVAVGVAIDSFTQLGRHAKK